MIHQSRKLTVKHARVGDRYLSSRWALFDKATRPPHRFLSAVGGLFRCNLHDRSLHEVTTKPNLGILGIAAKVLSNHCRALSKRTTRLSFIKCCMAAGAIPNGTGMMT